MGVLAAMLSCVALLTVLPLSLSTPGLRGSGVQQSSLKENATSTGGERRLADCTGDFVLDWTKTTTAFAAAGGSTTKLPTEATLKKYTKAACIHDAKEFAMFMANIMQESDKLQATSEYSSHFSDASYDWGEDEEGETCDSDTTDTKGCMGAACSSKCKVQYYGRGYLQTTWRENYVKAKNDGGCNSADIVKNPNKVATDTSLAWCTAAYYWKVAVHQDRCPNGGDSCDMGNTIHAINGAKECGANAAHKAEARQRYCYYAKFYNSYAETEPWADSVCISDLGKKYDDGTC